MVAPAPKKAVPTKAAPPAPTKKVPPPPPPVEETEEYEELTEELYEEMQEGLGAEEEPEEVTIPVKPKMAPTIPTNGKRPKVIKSIDFTALMDQIGSDNLGVLYLAARTKVRLMPLLEGRSPIVPVTTVYQGKTRTKYLMGVWNLTARTAEEGPADNRRVHALLLSKRTIKSILQYASEGWDLFSPESGRGLVLVKSGSGLSQEITISPSPNPIPVPEDIMEEWYDFNMVEIGEAWSKSQAARAEQKEAEVEDADETEEAPRPAARPAKKAKATEAGW